MKKIEISLYDQENDNRRIKICNQSSMYSSIEDILVAIQPLLQNIKH